MKLKIKNIIIYPKDPSLDARHIPFDPDKVNVIRGNSHKGKSAIIHIIDYCLGSDKCTIPVDKIRDNVFLFGIHIITENSEIFVAREEPGIQDTTHEMYLFEKTKIELSSLLALNKRRERFERVKVNRKTVINRFNQIAGFSSQRFDDDNIQNKWLEAASFRDTSAFQFQPQNIVANPTTLFYKADTYEHQNKLRIVFPLLLGYETNQIIELRRKKKDLDQQLLRRQNQLQEKKHAREVWKNEIYSHYNKAIDFGLTKNELNLEEINVDDIIYELESITNKIKITPIPLYVKGSSSKFASKLESLIKKRSDLVFEIDNKKMSLAKITQVNSSKNEYYEEVIKTKKERLKPVDWFIENVSNNKCPFCDSENHKAINQLLLLQSTSLKLNAIINDTNLDKEVALLEKELKKLEESLNDVNNVLNSIYNAQTAENNERKNVEEIYKFIGKIEEAIDNVKKTSIDGEFQKEIDVLKEQISQIEREMNKITNKLSESKALQNITLSISKYTELLDIERNKDAVKLDIQNLTIRIVNQSKNREDYFWEIGSGANHMGYHIATLLGLHEYFLELTKINVPNYVPSFIVFDQPSQVYFPKSVPIKVPKGVEKLSDMDGSKLGEDFKNTIKIFEACSAFIDRTKNQTQVIILEHVPTLTWHGIKDIHLVEEWDDDVKENNALIPESWLKNKE